MKGVRTDMCVPRAPKLGAPEGRSPFSTGADSPAARRPSTNLDRRKNARTAARAICVW
jgi:hypothetical protein